MNKTEKGISGTAKGGVRRAKGRDRTERAEAGQEEGGKSRKG